MTAAISLRRLTPFAIFTAILIAVSAGVLRDLVAFARTNDTASHVLLVPFITLALLYQERETIFADVRRATAAGASIVAVGALVLLTGGLLSGVQPTTLLSLRTAGLVVAWLGGFLLFYGGQAFRAALFPLLFFAFIIPIPPVMLDRVTDWLKTGSVNAAAALFSITGTPYLREGFVFSLPGLVIEVADECSGIRSSIGLLLTALLAGHAFLSRPWAKGILVLAVLPLAIFKNGLRIVTLTLLSMHVDRGFLSGNLHRDGGFVFFGIALAVLAPLLLVLRRYEAPRLSPEPRRATS